MDKQQEQEAKAAAKKSHESKDINFAPYKSGSSQLNTYVDELLNLTTEAGKKK